jgi:hypothetical protein
MQPGIPNGDVLFHGNGAFSDNGVTTRNGK